jgi:isopentenyldiphosphate isomerase
VDYILLGKHQFEIDHIKYNQDEVSDIKLVTQEELVHMVSTGNINITPWFKLVIQNRVSQIWDTIRSINISKESDRIICYL